MAAHIAQCVGKRRLFDGADAGGMLRFIESQVHLRKRCTFFDYEWRALNEQLLKVIRAPMPIGIENFMDYAVR
jgi:hypothetical protein